MASQIISAGKIILDVPYHSQFASIRNDDWKPRACTIVCLKMAMDFLAPEDAVDADSLFEESLKIKESLLEKGLITPKLASNGSVHDVVVFLAHNHGLLAHKEEFKSLNPLFEERMLQSGLRKVENSLKEGKPVIASVYRGLAAGQSFHTILLVGLQKDERGDLEGFYYHDPDAKEDERMDNQFIEIEKFKEYWRRLAIFFV